MLTSTRVTQSTDVSSVIDIDEIELCPSYEDDGLTGDIYMSECAIESLKSVDAIITYLNKNKATSTEAGLLAEASKTLISHIIKGFKQIYIWAKSWIEYLVNRIKGKFVESYVNSVLKALNPEQLKLAYNKYASTAEVNTSEIPSQFLTKNKAGVDSGKIQNAYDISIASLEGLGNALSTMGNTIETPEVKEAPGVTPTQETLKKEEADYVDIAIGIFMDRISRLGIPDMDAKTLKEQGYTGKELAYIIISGEKPSKEKKPNDIKVSDAYTLDELLSYFTSKKEVKALYVESAKSIKATQLILHDCDIHMRELSKTDLKMVGGTTSVKETLSWIKTLTDFTYTLFNYRMHNIKAAMTCIKSLYLASKNDPEIANVAGNRQSANTSSDSTTLGAIPTDIDLTNDSAIMSFCNIICKKQLAKLKSANTRVVISVTDAISKDGKGNLADCNISKVQLANGSIVAGNLLRGKTSTELANAKVFEYIIVVKGDCMKTLKAYAEKYCVTPTQWLAGVIVHEATHATQGARFDNDKLSERLAHLSDYNDGGTIASYHSYAVEAESFREQLKFLLSCGKTDLDKKIIREKFLKGFSGGITRTSLGA